MLFYGRFGLQISEKYVVDFESVAYCVGKISTWLKTFLALFEKIYRITNAS